MTTPPGGVRRYGCLAAMLVFFLLIGAFISCAVVSVVRGPQLPWQKDLYTSVEATVLTAEPRVDREDEGWVEYTYVVDGTTYRAGAGYFTVDWAPADGLVVCVNPDHPEKHAPLVVPGPECGDEHLKSSDRIADPVG